MTKGLALNTTELCDRKIPDKGPSYSNDERTQGSGMPPLGIPDADRRDPDLVKDPLRAREFAIRLSKIVDAQTWSQTRTQKPI